MFEAAKEASESTGTKVWGIGVDFDQYYKIGSAFQNYRNTSYHQWLKQVDVSIYNAMQK